MVKLEVKELFLLGDFDFVHNFSLLAAGLVSGDPLLKLKDSVLHAQPVSF